MRRSPCSLNDALATIPALRGDHDLLDVCTMNGVPSGTDTVSMDALFPAQPLAWEDDEDEDDEDFLDDDEDLDLGDDDDEDFFDDDDDEEADEEEVEEE